MEDQRLQKLAKATEDAMAGGVRVCPPAGKDSHIRFVGQKILAFDPKTNHLLRMAPYMNHPLVRARCFFAFPHSLWDDLYQALGKNRFDPELAILEETLAASCDKSGAAGLWKKEWISYEVLGPSAERHLLATDATGLGWETQQQRLDELVGVAADRLESIAKIARGYAGWLLTNRQFLDEHDQLLTRWADMVQSWGLGYVGTVLPTVMLLPERDPTMDPNWDEYKSTFEAFFARWRLQRLAAPYLPVPLRPFLAGQFPVSVVPQVNRAGGTFVLPDTFPVGTRDSLREMLTDAIRRPDETAHLAEWLEFVSTDNPARKPIARYARLLELQHYWRLLHHRHAGVMRRKMHVAKEVLAKFLNVSTETIHRDLLFLTKRLGRGWVGRGAGSPFGPF